MDGSKERKLVYENKIKNLISKCGNSSLLQKYNMYMSDKQEKTIYNYLMYIIMFLNYLSESRNEHHITVEILNSVYPYEINDFLNKRFKQAEQEYSTEHAAICWSALNSFYSFLTANFKREMNNGNPVMDTKRPKVKSKIRETYLKPREITKFLDAIQLGKKYENGKFKNLKYSFGARDYLMCQIFIQYGLRASSVAGINVEDFDLENRILTTHEKGDNINEYELTDNIIEAYHIWLSYRNLLLGYDEQDALFVSGVKKRLSYDAINDIVRWYGNYIGKPELTPHGLRHTFGTNLYNLTKDIRLVQEEMHHAKITTTERYITVSKDKKRAARAEMANMVCSHKGGEE